MLCQRLVQLFCDLKNPNASELLHIQYGQYRHFVLPKQIMDTIPKWFHAFIQDRVAYNIKILVLFIYILFRKYWR